MICLAALYWKWQQELVIKLKPTSTSLVLHGLSMKLWNVFGGSVDRLRGVYWGTPVLAISE